jgi:regulatory protein
VEGEPLSGETRGLDTPEWGSPSTGDLTVPGARRASPRKIALDILARREHSMAELREKLGARAGHHEWEPEEVEAALEALIDDGLLSEERFVASFVGSYTRRGHGPVWLRAELERRGIAGETIAEALASADTDWREVAAEVRRKRFGDALPADFKERARQARFLQYRGFTAEQALAACAKGTGP